MMPSYMAVRESVPRTPNNKIRKAGLLDAIDLDRSGRHRGGPEPTPEPPREPGPPVLKG
jgi:hypothetical protein